MSEILIEITEEELKRYKSIEFKALAIKQLIDKLIEKQEVLVTTREDWWLDIRNKYSLNQSHLNLDLKTGVIIELLE